MTAYSITPEGAKSAAAEIYWAESKVRSAVSWCNINDIAVIILRHAEQVDARQIVEAVLKFVTADEGVIRCEVDRAVREIEELRRAEQSSHDEGEMREACIVCGCALMPPERTELPHCRDCALTNEHYRAWGAGKGV